MEPPAKRRRRNPSLLANEDDDDDDDELFFDPQEVSARRDPGYKLSVKRANADHKLQATMAHIIEKYSHDFEGVGDEIDMETGEIVVNNGHLRSMRNEGDVGGSWIVDEDEDDEGIPLEDLTDEELDNFGANGEVRDSEDEEDLIMAGRQVAKPSNAMVSRTGVGLGHQDGRLSSLFPTPYGGAFGGPQLGFGASPLAFGAPQVGFGHSPLGFGPWGLPSGFGAPTWGSHGAHMNPHARQGRLALTAGGDRYEFPAQEGFESIWASGSGYDDDWATRPIASIRTGFRKHIAKRPPKIRSQKLLELASGDPHNDSDEDDDEEAILTGRTSKGKATESDQVISDSEDEDDLVLFNGNPSTTLSKSSPARIKGKVATRDKPTEFESRKPASAKKKSRKRKRLHSEGPSTDPAEGKKQLVATKVRKVPEDAGEDSGNRRRSGRARKQTEFMGKVRWLEADGRRKTADTLAVELLKADPESLKEFKRIDKVTGEEIHSATETDQDDSEICAEGDGESEGEGADDTAAPTRVIPNSQDSATPLTSSAPQDAPQKGVETQSGPVEEIMHFPGITSYNGPDSACALSDDEAPMLLPKPKILDINTAVTTRENLPQQTEEQASIMDSNLDAELASGVADQPQATPDIVPPRKRGRPKKSDAPVAMNGPEETPAVETSTIAENSALLSPPEDPAPEPASEVTAEAPRKRGRPRNSDVPPVVSEITSVIEVSVSKETTIQVAVDEEPETSHVPSEAISSEKPRPRGRPRKSEVSTVILETTPTVREEVGASGLGREAMHEAILDVSAQHGLAEDSRSSQPRPRGRPRKSENLPASQATDEPHMGGRHLAAEDSIQVSSPGERDVEQPRKRGRPRKSDISSSMPQATTTDEVPHINVEPEPGTALDPESRPEDQAEKSTTKHPANQSSKPQRLSRDLKWLQKWQKKNPKAATAIDPGANEMHTESEHIELPEQQLRSTRSREAITESNDAPQDAPQSQEEGITASAPAEMPAAPVDPYDLPEDPPPYRPSPGSIPRPTSTPLKPMPWDRNSSNPPSQQPTPSKPKPHTPRHTTIRVSHAPSSRRSLLSLLSDDEDDEDDEDDDADKDELSRHRTTLPLLQSSGAAPTRKLWRSSALTTEVYRTPVKKRARDAVSPGSVVRTPGGTTRMCGVDGYRCGRDFCFTCL